MISVQNDHFDQEVAKSIRQQLKESGKNHIINHSDENNDEFINFFFEGIHEGKPVLYDAALYTLRLYYNSELYEIAEHKAAQRFPEFATIRYEEDENGDLKELSSLEEEIGLFMTEVIMDIEEEGSIKVQEHVEIDPNLDLRVGLDAGLNVEEVNEKLVSDFVERFNSGALELDDTMYTFQTEDEDISF